VLKLHIATAIPLMTTPYIFSLLFFALLGINNVYAHNLKPITPKIAAETLPHTPYLAHTFEWSANCVAAHKAIMSLQLDKGKQWIEAEKAQKPHNLLPLLLEDYIDLFVIFISEDPVLFKQLELNKAKRLNAIDKAAPKSPYYRYVKAEINLHWAVSRLKFEEYFTAFKEVRTAYQLLNDNNAQYPNFYPNLKTLGLIHALVGTVPSKYKWGISLLGLSGNLQSGLDELALFVQEAQYNPDQSFYEEGLLIQIFLVAYLQNKPQEAWKMAAQLPTKQHLLNVFVAADMALRAGQNDRAIELLNEYPKPAAGFYDFPYLDFLLGACKLNRADVDANVYLQRFLNRFRGKNYVKDAFQRLAWYSLLNDEPEGYALYMELCRSKGATFIDADKQANKNAQSSQIPHKALLKARLLFDGGYCSNALSVMQTIKEQDLKNRAQQLEYQYRYGRIYQCKKNEQQAIAHYKTVIEKDSDWATTYYFAAKSCLQLGNIYEQKADLKTAQTYYQKSLNYKNHDYKNSFEQQAKAGLERVK
jgi:hypothetical protein